MNPTTKAILPLLIVFFAILFVCTALTRSLTDRGFEVPILITANTLFFLLSILSFFFQKKAMMNKNPHVFVRSVTGSMMMKMFVTVIAVFAYVYASDKDYSKQTVFVSLIFYLVYLATEVMVVMKMNKRKNA